MENKRKFKLFDMNRDGKGVDPNEDRTPNLKFFFKQFGRKFWRIITVNLIMLLQVLPIFVAILVYFMGPKTPTQYFNTYSVLYGMQTASPNPTVASFLTTAMAQFGLPAFNSYVYWVIIPLAVLTVVTMGWQNVGATYILRGFVRGDGVFIVSDYFYAIKKNFKQGLLLGILDSLFIFILGFDLVYFLSSAATVFNNIMSGIIVALIIMYLFMRKYMYLLLVTFNISIFKLLKNSLIFSALGIKRNLMAALGNVVLIAVSVLLIVLLLPIGFYPILIIPAFYLMGFTGFINAYAAYPVIDKYMIQPNR